MLIPPSVLKGLSHAASDELSRQAWTRGRALIPRTGSQLVGVHLERTTVTGLPGPASAAATDGKILAMASWDEPNWKEYPVDGIGFDPKPFEGFSVTIDTKDCRELAKLPTKNVVKPILGNVAIDEQNNGLGETTAMATDLDTTREYKFKPIEGTFPDYRMVLPKDSPQATIKLDIRQLERAVKIFKDTFGIRKNDSIAESGVELEIFSPDKPAKMTMAKNGLDVTVLAMPLVK